MKSLQTSRAVYQGLILRKSYILLAACALVGLLFLIDVMTGPAMLSVSDVFSTIISPKSTDNKTYVIVWVMRLPIAVIAVMVGASLGIAGAEMQTILDNPLASPYTLGISSAASFGAALAIVAGPALLLPETAVVPISAFFFALVSSLAIFAVSKAKRGSTELIVLMGIALVFLFSSLVSFLQYIARDNELQAIVFWIFGSLINATWAKNGIISLILLIVFPILYLDSWKLTTLRLGDSKAKSLGVNVERLRVKVLVIVSVMTAAAICFVGTIGFIGLVAPHLARSVVGEDHRFFMPLSGLIGALLLSFASIASKIIIPGAIFPIGVVTSLIGVPFMIHMVLTRKKTFFS